jgi:hypothetical protein
LSSLLLLLLLLLLMGIAMAMAPSKDGRMTSRSGGSCGRRGERTAEDVDFGFAPHSLFGLVLLQIMTVSNEAAIQRDDYGT